jgi:hypothetical protein
MPKPWRFTFIRSSNGLMKTGRTEPESERRCDLLSTRNAGYADALLLIKCGFTCLFAGREQPS